MDRHLNLVPSEFERLEKRVLPRFPFCYMTFKCSKNESQVFEVKDISFSGMQLNLKNGEHNFVEGEKIHGFIHWGEQTLELTGNVKWSRNPRVGVEFSGQQSFREEVDNFLNLESFAKSLKPLHEMKLGGDFPSNLKYWLRADGPVELFVWQHSNGEYSKIQILIMENFLEWEDTKGLKTARVMSKRDINTPLLLEDEFVFKFDDSIDLLKLERAAKLVRHLTESQITTGALEFIKLKIRS